MARATAIERFMAKVDHSGDCWLWIGALDRHGYGKFSVDRRTLIAHRWGYTALGGSIPEGLTLDHLCRVRRCVNPDHLEPVTQQVNLLRATKPECPQGHAYTSENTWTDGRGFRNCRICRRARGTEWKRQSRKKARTT